MSDEGYIREALGDIKATLKEHGTAIDGLATEVRSLRNSENQRLGERRVWGKVFIGGVSVLSAWEGIKALWHHG